MRLNSILKVYASRLEKNIDLISQMTGNKKIIPMLKANAYGHGLEALAHFFTRHYPESVDYLGVASLAEAIHLRVNIKLDAKKILVFSENDFSHSDLMEYYWEYNIIPVISNESDLIIFLEEAKFKHMPIVLKFDTGMNRLGIDWQRAEFVAKLLKQYNRPHVEHLMSHFACSYLQKNSMNGLQVKNFESVCSEFRNQKIEVKEISFHNSGAIEQGFEIPAVTHVRPGLMMYGPQSTMTNQKLWDGEIISELESQIQTVKPIKAGTRIGYGATEIPDDGLLAIIPIGYGDGLMTKLSGYSFKIEDVNARIVARVNMDMTYILIEDQKIEKYKNKKIKLWNSKQEDVINIAKHLGTHPYEVFCSLTSRIPREFISN
ncbi:MAG: alanine racemase [Halobacteriovoraceae bacterium]|nr:alanine racemase [Halobacteriovoraceae bacterium]MCB9094170.1 alanine racemase [Halobacteriovoraceae bacterium]